MREVVGIFFRVALLHAEQDHQPVSYLSDDGAIYFDASARDTLDYGAHMV
jgi:hypothetical protein